MNFEEDPWPREQGVKTQNALLLKLDAYEGPIDILLTLARDQKVDLSKISILNLAKQYLDFVEEAKKIRLELAADYLVMAAWLAYLKSKLLLPKQEDNTEELSGAEMAEALAFQMKRLEAMQRASRSLFDRPQLGKEIYMRGAPEGLASNTNIKWNAGIYDLLKAYGDMAKREEPEQYAVKPFDLVTMEHAMERVTKMLGKLPSKGKFSAWTSLKDFLPKTVKTLLTAKSALASTLTAALELAKQGKADIRQDGYDKPIFVRGKKLEEDNKDTNNE